MMKIVIEGVLSQDLPWLLVGIGALIWGVGIAAYAVLTTRAPEGIGSGWAGASRGCR